MTVEAKNRCTTSDAMSRSTVMMQGPGVVAPLVWTFAPNAFPQSLQNVAKVFSIHCLSWWNKFLMHMPSVPNFHHIFAHGSSQRLSRLLFIIDWHPSVLETLTSFVGLCLA